jgi:hypothetical protein
LRSRGTLLAILILILSFAPALRAAEANVQRAERLAKMTAEQKDELLHKKERFDALSTDEKVRLRSLHDEIEATGHARQLHQTLSRYNDWLKTLSSAERAELLGLDCDERIAKIKAILKRQESLRFREFAGNLPEQDRDAIYGWLEEFVEKHEEELLKRSPWPQFRQHKGDDPTRRRRMLMFTLLRRSTENATTVAPTREDFAELLPKLSEETRHEIERTPADRKPEVIRELVRATLYSKSMPQVSEDELRTYFAKLDPTERERLETLDREQMRRELTRMYHASQFRREGQPGFGPPPGAGFGPPPGTGFRKPGEGSSRFGSRGNGPSGSSRGGEGRGSAGEKNHDSSDEKSRGAAGEKGRFEGGRNDGGRSKSRPPDDSDQGD